MDTGVSFGSEAHRRPARELLWPVLPLAAVGWWVVGALPWVVDGLGARSPRDWTADIATGSVSSGYLSLLPFTAARMGLLLVVTLVGGLAAAVTTLWLRPRRGRIAARAGVAALGTVVAAAYAVAQSAGATRQLGSDFDRDDRVLLGVLAVAVAGTVVGLLLGLLVVLGRPVLRALAAAPLAVALGSWVSALVAALMGAERAVPLLAWTPTVSAVAVGLALAPVGVGSLSRVLVWPLVLVLVAVCTAAQTAFSHLTSYLRPRSGLPTGLRDHVEASRDVFLQAIQPEHQAWGTYAVAVVVGLLGAGALRARGPRRRAGADPQRPAVASAAARARTAPRVPAGDDGRVDATAR
ncbi:hypothetical protein [Terrabacter terrigena]|uniref:Uncharacterized protein n=1 Tax=Terrabacter terrigena TaxID=574718 RepID=A0ABW3N2Y4_9MICO